MFYIQGVAVQGCVLNETYISEILLMKIACK